MRAAIQKLLAPQQSSFIYQVKSSASFRFNWHFHPEYELTLIVRSQGKRFVADNISDYQDGDLVLLGPRLPHTWQSFSDSSTRSKHIACIIQFREDFLGSDFFDSLELSAIKGMLGRSAHGLCFSGPARDEAAERIVAMEKLSGLRRLTTFLEILELLARARKVTTISSPGFVPSLNHASHQRIDRVCRYVNENYTKSISQPQAADLVQMSSSTFRRKKKKTVGLTFVEYLNSLRISHACRLLIETDLSILEICHQSGFNNLSNFNRRFLKSKGVSPRQYRKSYIEL